MLPELGVWDKNSANGMAGAIASTTVLDIMTLGRTNVGINKPESTEAMGRGVDTRDDGQGKANGASPIPIDGDEGGVR